MAAWHKKLKFSGEGGDTSVKNTKKPTNGSLDEMGNDLRKQQDLFFLLDFK